MRIHFSCVVSYLSQGLGLEESGWCFLHSSQFPNLGQPVFEQGHLSTSVSIPNSSSSSE